MLTSMLRAIFFDFYSVWAPDPFAKYLVQAERDDKQVAEILREDIKKYYYGIADADYIANSFKISLGIQDIEPSEFIIKEPRISPDKVQFFQNLHNHFVKVGILADMGKHEHGILTKLNNEYKLFENISSSYSLGHQILDSQVFAKVLQAVGEPIEFCLIVTGNTEYIDFAEKLGFKTIKYVRMPDLIKSVNELL